MPPHLIEQYQKQQQQQQQYSAASSAGGGSGNTAASMPEVEILDYVGDEDAMDQGRGGGFEEYHDKRHATNISIPDRLRSGADEANEALLTIHRKGNGADKVDFLRF